MGEAGASVRAFPSRSQLFSILRASRFRRLYPRTSPCRSPPSRIPCAPGRPGTKRDVPPRHVTAGRSTTRPHPANGSLVPLPIQAAAGRDVLSSGLPRLSDHRKGSLMSIGMILLIVLVLMLLGVLPSWGHSRNWGYGPSGGLGLVLVIVLVLVFGVAPVFRVVIVEERDGPAWPVAQ